MTLDNDDITAITAALTAAILPVRLADAVAHGGTLGSSTATLALSRIVATSQTTNTNAFTLTGNGTGAGLRSVGGLTGRGASLEGGSTSGAGLEIGTSDGHGIVIAPAGDNRHGIVVSGSSDSGTCDAIKFTAGTGGLASRYTGGITVTGAITATSAGSDINGVNVQKINDVAPR